jgi:putative transposase
MLDNSYIQGEEWALPEGNYNYVTEFGDGQMLFEPVHGKGHLIRSEDELMEQHASGIAVRKRLHRNKRGELQRTNRLGMVPPNDGEDPIVAAKEMRARSRQFFVSKFDDACCGMGKKALSALIAAHRGSAAKLGYTWIPSVATLARAINHRGEPGRRPLDVMQDQRGLGRRDHFGPVLNAILDRTINWYYAKRERTHKDAYARLFIFVGSVNKLGRLRYAAAWKHLETPGREALRVRINAAETLETLTNKFNATEARRRLRGIVRGLRADAILELVVIDANVFDTLVIDDETRLLSSRPMVTAAIDMKSRVILGISINFGGETLESILDCTSQIITGKHAIIDRLPQYRGLLDDIYGKPETILVDNAWRQTGVSYKDACADVGINVEYAPVRNPETKAPLERFWKTLNGLVAHKAPGGIPVDPAMMRRLGSILRNPRQYACANSKSSSIKLFTTSITTRCSAASECRHCSLGEKGGKRTDARSSTT